MAEFINWREHDVDLVDCTCADPDACCEPVPGRVCRRDVRRVAKQVAADIDKALGEQVYGLMAGDLPPCTSPVGCIRMAAPTCRKSGKCLDTSYREGVMSYGSMADWYGDIAPAPDDLALARFEDEGGPPEVEAEHCSTCGGPCVFSRPTHYRRRGSYTGSAS